MSARLHPTDHRLIQRQHGFSLVELLMIVTIITILSVIAVPSYNAVIAKSERAEAYADLNKIAQAQERYFTANRSYTESFVELNMTANNAPFSSSKGTSTYSMAATNNITSTSCNTGASPNTGCNAYILTSTPNGGKNTWTLTLDQAGVKTSTNGTNNNPNSWPE